MLEWCSYIQFAPEQNRFDLHAWLIDKRTERQGAEGCFHILLDTHEPLSDAVSFTQDYFKTNRRSCHCRE
jgi:hypothetical protein